jgi:hypothetical protein
MKTRSYKFFVVFFYFLIILVNLSAQSTFVPQNEWREGIGTGISFDFLGNYVIKSGAAVGGGKFLNKGEFKIEYVNKVPFLIIDWLAGGSDRYMMLANDDFMFLYDEANSEPVFRLLHYEYRVYEDFTEWHFRHISPVVNVTASSSLTENNINYSPDNINIKQNSVWADGVAGNGINERITFRTIQSHAIYISTGYVSYLKPNLYTENSRPKKIRVFSGDDPPFDVSLDDTPAFQRINAYGGTITIQILEVYPGTKYEDTCINSILYDFSQ